MCVYEKERERDSQTDRETNLFPFVCGDYSLILHINLVSYNDKFHPCNTMLMERDKSASWMIRETVTA